MMTYGASAGQAGARRRDAVDAPGASSRSGNEADACPPPRPSGLRLADLLASLLARYIPQRVCASLAPCHQACEPAEYVIIFMGRDTKLYDKYEKLIPVDKMKNGTNEMNILGMRHHDIGSAKDLRKYDDRFVVLWKDESGQKHVKVFEGATHTGQTDTKGNFTDVNKDGKADIAHIKPGTYDFHLGRNQKFGDHLRPDSKIDAWRDTNQDGRITGDEKNKDYTASAILFHKGGPTAPRSVGCQTLEPNEFEKFIDLIKQDPNDKVSYTLVDASKS